MLLGTPSFRGSANAHQFDGRLLADLFRAGCTTVNPSFYLRYRFWSGQRRQCAAFPWAPTPADKIVVRDVMEKVFKGSSAILLRIFDLLAKLGRRASNKHHLVLGGR